MSTPINHSKKYSLSDIEQYLQGKLSPAEMHELEKAAVQDPFLADAMEGYQSADLIKADQDLAAIRSQLLQNDADKAPVIELLSIRKNWLRAASIILLLAGSSTFAWFLFRSTPQKKEMVQRSVQNTKTDSLQTTTATTTIRDTISKTKKDILATVPAIQEKPKQNDLINSVSHNKNAEMAAAIKESFAETAKKSMDTLSDKMLMQSSAALNKSSVPVTASVGALQPNAYRSQPLGNALTISSGAQANITSVGQLTNLTSTNLLAAGTTINHAPINILQGKVVDVNNKPISFATVTAPNQIIYTDTAGIFKLQVIDSIPKVKINALSFEETTAQLKVSEPNKIVLKDFSGSLNEVVVVGYQAQRKKDLTGSITSKKETVQTGLSVVFYPEIGWDSLVSYLRNKINIASSDKSAKGDIKVKLTTKQGKISKVEVLESFNQSFNKKIIRALKNVPRWICNDSSENEQTHIANIHL